jgi:hypothetical protein
MIEIKIYIMIQLLKKKLEDKTKYTEDELIKIVKELYLEKEEKNENNIQKSLYIEIRIKELKKTINKEEEELYKIALNDYNRKSI